MLFHGKKPKPAVVRLEHWEYIHAHDIGIKRAAANWGVPDSLAMADKSRQQPNRLANPGATICELAVAKYLNQYWSGSIWPRKEHDIHKVKADVGKNVEVRQTLVEGGNWIVVRKSGNFIPNAVVFSAHINYDKDIEGRIVEICGWIPQDIGWRDGVAKPSYDLENDTVRLFPLSEARAPHDYFLHNLELLAETACGQELQC